MRSIKINKHQPENMWPKLCLIYWLDFVKFSAKKHVAQSTFNILAGFCQIF